ncbi:DUF5911 domain-containing protein [Paraburkholderia sp. MMS20-SJTN17]|uniref:DUF5911 domain-containing protein n=1 Tax=Paraburkholderia translucens TaxID=2886945 RepID=A0ABS8KDE5_9BURK|nr:trehalase-like domain-containing protein [Paraburkholderia sp. MMS20-SJTN17]MCC8402677.1 DUF5911 domain-containing protein [Paraburkholderia sp. MMS20-SJTN17]
MSPRIADYALVGNGETAALVSREGTIDWLCWPRFDDDACLAALLGTPDNGCWTLTPVKQAIGQNRRYVPDTLIVQTDIQTADGEVRLIDFMPISASHNAIIRIIVGLSGAVLMRSTLRLRNSEPNSLSSRRDDIS